MWISTSSPDRLPGKLLVEGFMVSEISQTKTNTSSISGYVEPVDIDGWLGYAILYKGLEHPQILVSAGVLEPIPCRQGSTLQ